MHCRLTSTLVCHQTLLDGRGVATGSANLTAWRNASTPLGRTRGPFGSREASCKIQGTVAQQTKTWAVVSAGRPDYREPKRTCGSITHMCPALVYPPESPRTAIPVAVRGTRRFDAPLGFVYPDRCMARSCWGWASEVGTRAGMTRPGRTGRPAQIPLSGLLLFISFVAARADLSGFFAP